jgi:predicted RNase H-like HicB family nuclease
MEIRYTYKQDGKFLIGHINEYPEYPTQAFSIEELEENLQDIFGMIQDGTLEVYNKHGVMEAVV